MTINQVVMYVLAFGALVGGIDRLIGNRFGFGDKFESGFRMLGPVALSIAGIICFVPVLSNVLGVVMTPVCNLVNIDPALFGTILATDLGGYQLSMDLANNPEFGKFCGIIITAIFGCTIVYILPVGLGFLKEDDAPHFVKGILIGLVTMPAPFIIACLMLKMNLLNVLWNCLPIFILSILLGIGVAKKPAAMIRGFLVFAKIIRGFAILGLLLATLTYMTGFEIIPGLAPIQESMKSVNAICIVMLGSMPLAEIIQRIMKVPFRKINDKIAINGASTTGLVLSIFSATPALALVPQMNRRGQVVMSACYVSCINLFGAHFAAANSASPDMVPYMIAAKVSGCIISGAVAMLATRNMKKENDLSPAQ